MIQYVKINYLGKEYIGLLKSVDSRYEFIPTLGRRNEEWICSLLYYEISLYDIGTHCVIDGIRINSLDEIEILSKGGENQCTTHLETV